MQADLERIVRNLDTAYHWSSSSGDGLGLYSLASTRTLQSEEHREQLVREIDALLAWNAERAKLGRVDESNDPSRDMPRLQDLKSLVDGLTIGRELITDAEYQRRHDQLYKSGRL